MGPKPPYRCSGLILYVTSQQLGDIRRIVNQLGSQILLDVPAKDAVSRR